MREPRSERLNLRASPTEVRMLEELSEASGLAMSDIVRQLVRQEHEAMFEQRSGARRRRRVGKASSR